MGLVARLPGVGQQGDQTLTKVLLQVRLELTTPAYLCAVYK